MMKKEKMRMKNKTNCAGHTIFLAELPSNCVVVESLNKHPFLKVEGWALIRGMGISSRWGALIQ